MKFSRGPDPVQLYPDPQPGDRDERWRATGHEEPDNAFLKNFKLGLVLPKRNGKLSTVASQSKAKKETNGQKYKSANTSNLFTY